jgi:hypothetical protein
VFVFIGTSSRLLRHGSPRKAATVAVETEGGLMRPLSAMTNKLALLIAVLAQLIGAIAQLVAALRPPH